MEKSLQIFTELLNNYKLNEKDSLTIIEIEELVKKTEFLLSEKSNQSDDDIRINHIRQTYTDIANKITDIKKLDKYPDYIFYMVGNSVFMKHDLISDIVYIRYWGFWELFAKKFNLNNNQISLLLKSFLQVHLECYINTTKCESINDLERYFK